MKIFTYKQRAEIINATVKSGTNINEIVARMGEGVASEIAARHDPATKIVLFAGWGMKGAYAMSAAKTLMQQGFEVETYLFNIGGKRLTNEAYNALLHLEKACPDAKVVKITKHFEIPDLNADMLVLDGLFGAELDRPLPPSFGMLIRTINESGAPVVSIEIPSGLFSEWNETNVSISDIIHASLTLGVQFPCMAYFMKENIDLIGEWKLIDVGLDHEAIRQTDYSYYLVTRRDIHNLLPPREAYATKSDFGTALVCAGSYGMMGAAVLTTAACCRAGAGKVTCYAPGCGYNVLQTAVPSAMFMRDPNEEIISNIEYPHRYDTVAIGPGFGTEALTINAVERFLKRMYNERCPLVIDADALNCIARRPNMMNYVPQDSVLTPHENEFDRIFGKHTSTEARIKRALEVAAYHNVVIVLKGHYTATVRPDGKVLFNSSGTPALATAGAGDVLTGIITSFMAQRLLPEIAAITGVYIHGIAGHLAEEEQGTYGVTAEDLVGYTGKAIKKIMDTDD